MAARLKRAKSTIDASIEPSKKPAQKKPGDPAQDGDWHHRRPKSIESALKTVPLALPVGGRMREKLERIAEAGGSRLRVIVGCSSYLQAAQVLESGMCATVLPDLALSALKLDRFHRSSLPDAYELCLAWSKRNADTRPALTGLIERVIEEIKGGDLP